VISALDSRHCMSVLGADIYMASPAPRLGNQKIAESGTFHGYQVRVVEELPPIVSEGVIYSCD